MFSHAAELMKFDCGGSAAVLGAARAVSELQPEGVEAHFVVGKACSNFKFFLGRRAAGSEIFGD